VLILETAVFQLSYLTFQRLTFAYTNMAEQHC